MLLSIKEMEVRSLPFAETWQPGAFDLQDSGAVQKSPLVAEGVAELVPYGAGEVRVHGLAVTDLETECDRCLSRAHFHIDAPFDLRYRPSSAVIKENARKDALKRGAAARAVREKQEEEEIALDESEAEVGFYELPGLELDDIIREQLLFQLPMQRVCSESCKGICPHCGSNRNEKSCECEVTPGRDEAKPGDERWGALKKIQLSEKVK